MIPQRLGRAPQLHEGEMTNGRRRVVAGELLRLAQECEAVALGRERSVTMREGAAPLQRLEGLDAPCAR